MEFEKALVVAVDAVVDVGTGWMKQEREAVAGVSAGHLFVPADFGAFVESFVAVAQTPCCDAVAPDDVGVVVEVVVVDCEPGSVDAGGAFVDVVVVASKTVAVVELGNRTSGYYNSFHQNRN